MALTLSAGEFIRRFLVHAIPPGFVRIRHFGFLTNRAKGRDLECCRRLLGVPEETQTPEDKTPEEALRELTGEDITRCPDCRQGAMQTVAELPRLFARSLRDLAPRQAGWDTS